MDISAFSDENFDTVAWVNNLLNNSSHAKKENYTMSLVMKLQLYVQQVNAALESTSDQVLDSLPKIVRDARNLQEEARILKEKMAVVKDEVVKVEQETGNSIASIEKLDKMKSALIEAKQSLHESDNWTILVNDLEELFETKKIEQISTKITGMQRSLKLLANVADYEERKLQLEGLKNRLEAIASPSIVQAFNTNNSEQAIMFARIFFAMDRTAQLLKYYHKCQVELLLQRWRHQFDVEQDENVMVWMHNFYDILLSNWHTQYKWFHQIFPNQPVSASIINVYTDVLNSMDPSIDECLSNALKQTSEKLAFLQEVKQIMKQFAENVTNIKENKSAPNLSKLLSALYRPLLPHLAKYAGYEQAHLCQQLTALECIKDELPDTIQALGLAMASIMDFVSEARNRCAAFTERCGQCGLLSAVRALFVAHADQYRLALRQLERNKLRGEDWETFKQCFSLLQNTGEVLLKVQQVESDITGTILELQRTTDPQTNYRTLLLNENSQKELTSLIRCVTEGTELTLLEHVLIEFGKLCADIHHLIYQVVLSPISIHFEVVSKAQTWAQLANSAADAPDYSFTPQEYITEIGQYLMTLPQHLEPFLFHENPALTCALRATDSEYASAGETEGALTEIFLGIVVRGTCQTYADNILSICELNFGGSRQLAHDIGYLGNVVDDLGLSITDNMKQIASLLKLPADQYQAKSIGCSPRQVAAIRQIRNITSSG